MGIYVKGRDLPSGTEAGLQRSQGDTGELKYRGEAQAKIPSYPQERG